MQSYNNAQHSCSGSVSAILYQQSLSKIYAKQHVKDELFSSII